MTIDQVIALIASIATFVTSIIVLLTLFEMQKQRKSTFRPDIVLNTPSFYIYPRKYWDKSFPVLFSSKELTDTKLWNNNDLVGIDAFNIGLGPAKDVKVVWDFDENTFLQRIEDKNKENFLDVKYNKDSKLKVDLLNNACIYVYTKLNMKDRLNYVLPSQIEHKPVKIRLPSNYLHLISVLLYLENLIKLNAKIDFPHLKMALKYEDIGNNEHKKEFILKFKISGLGKDLLGNINYVRVNINLKQVD